MSEARPTGELTAAGVVIGHSSGRSYSRSGVIFFPSVRFLTADGRTVEFQNKVGTNAPRQDEVTVLYSPDQPEDAKIAVGDPFKIDGKLLLTFFGIFLAVVVLMFLAVFALVVWVSLS